MMILSRPLWRRGATEIKGTSMDDLESFLARPGLCLRIGLTDQGHMPKVEQMLKDRKSWDEIGKAIGWHGPAVKEWYEYEKSKP